MAVFGRERRGRDRTGTPADLLVIGLGNPGEQYAGSRHNVGARTVDVLTLRHGGRLRKSKEYSLTDQLRIGDANVAVAFPVTFMNDSGRAASALVRRYGIDDLEQMVVVHDELDLEPGVVRVKLGGGLAGHNGLRSIRDHLHSVEFGRVRIGVGKPPGRREGADHVLRKVSKSDREVLDIAVEQAADAVECILAHGYAEAMNRFNGGR